MDKTEKAKLIKALSTAHGDVLGDGDAAGGDDEGGY